jgi:hypothetical protein
MPNWWQATRKSFSEAATTEGVTLAEAAVVLLLALPLVEVLCFLAEAEGVELSLLAAAQPLAAAQAQNLRPLCIQPQLAPRTPFLVRAVAHFLPALPLAAVPLGFQRPASRQFSSTAPP